VPGMLPMRFVSNPRRVSAVPTGPASISLASNAALKRRSSTSLHAPAGRPLFHQSIPAIRSSRAMPPIMPWKSGPSRAALRAVKKDWPLGPVYRFGILHNDL
jgi:hypothetical protein